MFGHDEKEAIFLRNSLLTMLHEEKLDSVENREAVEKLNAIQCMIRIYAICLSIGNDDNKFDVTKNDFGQILRIQGRWRYMDEVLRLIQFLKDMLIECHRDNIKIKLWNTYWKNAALIDQALFILAKHNVLISRNFISLLLNIKNINYITSALKIYDNCDYLLQSTFDFLIFHTQYKAALTTSDEVLPLEPLEWLEPQYDERCEGSRYINKMKRVVAKLEQLQLHTPENCLMIGESNCPDFIGGLLERYRLKNEDLIKFFITCKENERRRVGFLLRILEGRHIPITNRLLCAIKNNGYLNAPLLEKMEQAGIEMDQQVLLNLVFNFDFARLVDSIDIILNREIYNELLQYDEFIPQIADAISKYSIAADPNFLRYQKKYRDKFKTEFKEKFDKIIAEFKAQKKSATVKELSETVPFCSGINNIISDYVGTSITLFKPVLSLDFNYSAAQPSDNKGQDLLFAGNSDDFNGEKKSATSKAR